MQNFDWNRVGTLSIEIRYQKLVTLLYENSTLKVVDSGTSGSHFEQ